MKRVSASVLSIATAATLTIGAVAPASAVTPAASAATSSTAPVTTTYAADEVNINSSNFNPFMLTGPLSWVVAPFFLVAFLAVNAISLIPGSSVCSMLNTQACV